MSHHLLQFFRLLQVSRLFSGNFRLSPGNCRLFSGNFRLFPNCPFALGFDDKINNPCLESYKQIACCTADTPFVAWIYITLDIVFHPHFLDMEKLDQSSLHPLLEHLETNMCLGRESNPGRCRRALEQRAIRTACIFVVRDHYLCEDFTRLLSRGFFPRHSKIFFYFEHISVPLL